MDLERREQLLHKVVAGSALAFAVSILPVAQYYLTPFNGTAATPETGTVAGVSTDADFADIPAASPSPSYATLAECQAAKDSDLANLDRYLQGKKLADLAAYNKEVDPYQQALKVLKGTPDEIAQNTTALNQLIDQTYQPYLKKLSDVESAVESQKNEISSRVCPSE
jgi:hypothetical protein